MQHMVTRDQATQKTLAEHDLLFKNQQSAMLDMQRTIGDIARKLNERPPGQFSGSTQQNPAAQIKAITTRSGKVLGPEVRRNKVEVEDEELVDEEIEMEVPGKVQNTAPVAPPVEKKLVEVRPSPLIDHSLDKFVFPVDFVVLDMEADEKVPIILGRPFLRTAKVWINALITFVLCENDSVCDELADISGLLEMIEVNEFSCESEADSVEKQALLELKVLPSHLEYAYIDEVSNLPVIVSSKLMEEQKTKLIDVLKLHKGEISWRLSDIQGISPAYCTHRILIEDEYKPVVQPQRHLNLNMQEVVKKEVLKLMDAGMIYPISDSLWVSPTQVVPKKGGMTVVMNEKSELISSRTVTGWHVCIDYQRLNDATRKDHFPLPFIDMMSERLAGQQFYCFLDGRVVLGYKISRDGIEVDWAKIDTISRLPPPTNVKAIRSFLGHAGVYRRFIKDFSKITRLMTRLLEKDVPFLFDDECVKAFMYLKEKIASAPILCSPDWSLLKTLNDDQENYTTTEKELLAVVFAFDKFRSYLKKDPKPRLIRWILLLSEFDIEIKDKRGAENVAADHLSCLEDLRREELCEEEIGDTFPHESIDFVAAEKQGTPWFSDFANYLANGFILEGMTMQQKRKFFRDVNRYVWDDPFLFKIGGDRILRRCVTKEEGWDILKHVEAQELAKNDARVVKFLKKLFTRVGIPRAIISDRGTHFYNTVMEKALARYGVTNRTSTAYHP
ncbi:uncharacterized protein LOC143608938 [Bidens hawaiensis]|uniref:uncharacterized protein LOC143608938 n=1 Tax=Bidens hawaiensis TaxID=980011 RepID=UPI00404A5CDC